MKTRRFVDPAGWTWQAIEICPTQDEAHALLRNMPERPVLYFISRYSTRRMDEFPDDWPALPSPQLAKLCDRAKAVQSEWPSRRLELHQRAPDVL